MAKQVKKNKGKKWFLPALVVLTAIALIAGYLASPYLGGKGSNRVLDISELRGGETRPTLSPAMFVGKTATAYQIAKEIPDVLDSLYCYCDCKKHFGHKSLLTCYVDDHAVHCDICMDEAIRAYELYREGKDILTIRRTIDREFS